MERQLFQGLTRQILPTHTSPARGGDGEGERRAWPLGLFLVACASLLIGAGAHAESTSLHADWYAPRAAEFARDGQQLAPALQALCAASPEGAGAALQQARDRWRAALASWERLSAVAIGPLLERRSQRQIDFMPTRPRMIEKAVKASPTTPADMERIGTPAKGFPALEWLLWVKPARPASPECRYAVQVAAEIGREAEALAAAKAVPGDSQDFLSDLVNQWIGGLERLRWAHMELPLRQTMTAEHAGGTPDFPRKASAASASSWAHQWQALKALATGPASLGAALVARGQAADGLAQAVRQADVVMADLSAGDEQRILAAAQALADLQRHVETQVAPALGVSIGFSDADGD